MDDPIFFGAAVNVHCNPVLLSCLAPEFRDRRSIRNFWADKIEKAYSAQNKTIPSLLEDALNKLKGKSRIDMRLLDGISNTSSNDVEVYIDDLFPFDDSLSEEALISIYEKLTGDKFELPSPSAQALLCQYLLDYMLSDAN